MSTLSTRYLSGLVIGYLKDVVKVWCVSYRWCSKTRCLHSAAVGRISKFEKPDEGDDVGKNTRRTAGDRSVSNQCDLTWEIDSHPDTPPAYRLVYGRRPLRIVTSSARTARRTLLPRDRHIAISGQILLYVTADFAAGASGIPSTAQMLHP